MDDMSARQGRFVWPAGRAAIIVVRDNSPRHGGVSRPHIGAQTVEDSLKQAIRRLQTNLIFRAMSIFPPIGSDRPQTSLSSGQRGCRPEGERSL